MVVVDQNPPTRYCRRGRIVTNTNLCVKIASRAAFMSAFG